MIDLLIGLLIALAFATVYGVLRARASLITKPELDRLIEHYREDR